MTSRMIGAAVTTLLLIQASMLTYSARVHSPTWDEVGHLAAGISHAVLGRVELFSVNPPLVRTIASAQALVCAKTPRGLIAGLITLTLPNFLLQCDCLRLRDRAGYGFNGFADRLALSVLALAEKSESFLGDCVCCRVVAGNALKSVWLVFFAIWTITLFVCRFDDPVFRCFANMKCVGQIGDSMNIFYIPNATTNKSNDLLSLDPLRAFDQ